MKLNEYLQQRLEDSGLSRVEFQELVIRLINYSVIARGESQTEQALFDRLLRCREIIEEYLLVMGIKLYIDTRFEYARVFPPASEIPGIKEADDNAWSGSLRQRLSQFEVALVLVIRAQYEKALREGKIDDKGYAIDSIESLTIAAKNLLGRNLPEKLTERKKLFQRLRQLRLIDFRADEAFDMGEGWIKIHPMIITFVSNSAVESIAVNDSVAEEPVKMEGTKVKVNLDTAEATDSSEGEAHVS